MLKSYLEHKETERLIIRPLSMDDILIWEDFLLDPIATKFFPKDLRSNRAFSKTWIEGQITRYQNNNYGLLALIESSTGNFIGQCGLITQQVDGKKEIEIGYHLLTKFRGNGFATEASKKFREIGFEIEKHPSIISIIHIDNLASQRVAERNGMKRTTKTVFKGLETYIYRINQHEYIAYNNT